MKNKKNLQKLVKVLRFSKEQMNNYYDPSMSSNGGGYDQPWIEVEFLYKGFRHLLTIDDSSCGDFGHRYLVTLEGKLLKGWIDVDTMNHSEFSQYMDSRCQAVLKYLGYDGYLISKSYDWYDAYDEEYEDEEDYE